MANVDILFLTPQVYLRVCAARYFILFYSTLSHTRAVSSYIHRARAHHVHTLFRHGVRRDSKILDLPGALKWQMASDDAHPPRKKKP